MSVTVKTYSPSIASQYERLLEESPVAMFNHSLRYRDFLKTILQDATDNYLCAFREDELIAVLPAFIKEGPYGAVVNSLPFYGSHGGFVYREYADTEVLEVLMSALADLCDKVSAFSCTIIESPMELDKEMYKRFAANVFDDRIGQITSLPTGGSPVMLSEVLLASYHQKTRNMVRKGMKGGFDVSHDGSKCTIATLHAIHEENILGIGGQAKPLEVFQAITDCFDYDRDYRIYLARKDGRIVSALLVFYFKDMVEYFCPATVNAYRSDQPLSLLIFTAMRDAVLERGARQWNWGGTWLSQTGVYQFKARWGTRDCPYRYHIKLSSGYALSCFRKDALLSDYKYFYTMPFNVLGGR